MKPLKSNIGPRNNPPHAMAVLSLSKIVPTATPKAVEQRTSRVMPKMNKLNLSKLSSKPTPK